MQKEGKQEVDALCPDCGHGFKAYLDRITPKAPVRTPSQPVACPNCGCRECRIK